MPWIEMAYEEGRRDGFIAGVLSVVVLWMAWKCYVMWVNQKEK